MADTWYLKISPMNEPHEEPLDRNGRAVRCFTILAVKRPSETFVEELVKVLVTAGVGVFNTNIFASASAVLPGADNEGPFIVIAETSGAAPMLTQNEPTTPSYPRPTARIAVHAKATVDARAKAYQAYNALAAIRNQNISIP